MKQIKMKQANPSMWRVFKKNWELLALCIPAIVCYILFAYLPMGGLVMAFKDFRYNLGIFGSPWIGFKNFEFLFTSSDLYIIVRNTVGYGVLFIAVNLVVCVIFALLLFEVSNRKALKFYQTSMLLPNFLSWVIIGFITYAIFNPVLGLLHQVNGFFGGGWFDVYVKRGLWPFILTIVNQWKGLGLGVLIYYAALMGIDTSLYEAAKIDGASRWKQTLYVSLPGLVPLIIILTIMSMGGIFKSDVGLFYAIPRNVGILNPAVDVIDTYVLRGITSAGGTNFTTTSAIGMVQSVLGLVLVVLTNSVVRKISPDNSLF